MCPDGGGLRRIWKGGLGGGLLARMLIWEEGVDICVDDDALAQGDAFGSTASPIGACRG